MKKGIEKGRGIAMGLLLGTAIGVATNNIGLWLALGIVFGAAWEAKQRKKTDQEEGYREY